MIAPTISEAAAALGRKAKGVKKTLTEAQREAMRERMRAINARRVCKKSIVNLADGSCNVTGL